VGGWGHILGDRGSAFDIGLTAVRWLLAQFDRSSRWPALGQRILRALLLNGPEELVGWAHAAAKHEIAALAQEVFAAWEEGDRLAGRVVHHGLSELVHDALACATRLAARPRSTDFVLAGGTFLGQNRFAARFGSWMRRARPGCSVRLLKRESVWGAVDLARESLEQAEFMPAAKTTSRETHAPQTEDLRATLLSSPTEQRNPRSMNLHRMPLDQAVRLMLEEEATVAGALLEHRRQLVRAVRLVERGFRAGGRLFYVGAGTSGRLGVLDASECPPTFRTPPGMVQGIMAGGQRALWEAVEGAEDDFEAGEQVIRARGIGARDVVVGIAASGRTPFVWGALGEARRVGARAVLLCFNPRVAIPAGARKPDLVIAVSVGPEVLTGSTRLKAGTATKLVLNLLTTLSMVRLGKVFSNLMVDVKPTNAKLRDRAVRIVREITGWSEEHALEALERTGWDIQRALARLGR
jgi:N-acetylmuramic acid 6-phosphate etherase